MSEHRCYKCGETKPASEFGKRTAARNGLSNICRSCKRPVDAEYRKNNKEKLKAAYHKMIEQRPTFWADYYAKHRSTELIRVATWSKKNAEKKSEMYREWYVANPDYHPAWRDKNRDKVKERGKRSHQKRMSSAKCRLEASIRTGVSKGIANGSKASRRTFDLLGYTVDQLMRHLERRFQPGMSWDNYGEWHIDHIIPLSAHNYETPDDIDFKKAWALKNLQPLWAKENIRKHARIDGAFQPSLALH